MSTDHDEIEAIRARWAEATPGPWCWEGTFSSHGIRLVSPSSRVRPSRLVMGFERWGMSRASPVFQLPDLTVRAAREISVRHPKYLNDIKALNHPTAIAIAAAPADVQTLLRVVDALAAELRKLRAVASRIAQDGDTITLFPRTWHDSDDCAGGGACRCGGAGGDFTCTVCNGTGGAIVGAK